LQCLPFSKPGSLWHNSGTAHLGWSQCPPAAPIAQLLYGEPPFMALPAVVLQLRCSLRSSSYRERYSERINAAVDRLLEHVDIFPIWEELSRDPDPALPYALLETCAHAMWEWDRMPRVPDTEIKRHLLELADAADSLANGLDRHAGEIAFCGFEFIVSGYLARPSTTHAEHADPPETKQDDGSNETTEQKREMDGSGSYRAYYDAVQGPMPFQSFLRHGAERLRTNAESSLPLLRPTKRRAEHAERTFLVRTLVHFFITHGGQPHWDWVARIVSAITNTDDLDGRHVQLLFADLANVEWDQAEDYRPNDDAE
jgi:hypothetical protein